MLETITKKEIKELKEQLEVQKKELKDRKERLKTLTLQQQINEEKDIIKTLKESVKSLESTLKKVKKIEKKRDKEEKKRKKEEKSSNKNKTQKVLCYYKETIYKEGWTSVKLEYDKHKEKKLSEDFVRDNYHSNKKIEEEHCIIKYKTDYFVFIKGKYYKEMG